MEGFVLSVFKKLPKASKERSELSGYIGALFAIVSGAISVWFFWRILTSDYPTHSDVFWIGVETGVLVMFLAIFIFLTFWYLIRFLMFRKSK